MKDRFDPIALPWPAAFTAIFLVIFVVTIGFGDAFEAVREAGLVGYATIFVAIIGGMTASACVALLDVPRAVAIGCALLPWLVGSAGAFIGLGKIVAALGAVDPADHAVLLAEGTKEVLASRDFGALASAGGLFGLAISFFARARHERGVAIAGAGASIAAFFLALQSHGAAHQMRHALNGVASAAFDPASRAAIVAESIEHAGASSMLLGGLAGVGVVVAAIAVTLRRERVPDTIVALVVVAVPMLADRAVLADANAHANVTAPWSVLPSFDPVVFANATPIGHLDMIAYADEHDLRGLSSSEGRMRTPADVVTATSQAYRKDAYVVALDKRATGAAIHVATQGAHDAGFARVTFVGAAAPSPAAELVADKPVLRAVLVPPTATRDVRAGCDDDDALAHLAKSAGGPGIELATARVPPITLPSGRLCIVIGPSDTGDGLASALENLAAQHVDVAIGAAPAARNDDDDALGYGHTHARLTDEERRIARLSDDFDAPQRTREAIRAFVVSRSHDVRACYERGLARNPKVAGTLKVAFVIERDGHVDDVTVVDDGVHDQDIVACIVARIGTWKGMRPSDEPTHVSYPFVLKAAE